MASVRAVLCYVALFAFTVFYVKEQAFCSSDQLYDVEQNHGPKETFIYSSLWSFRRISGTGLRTSRTSLLQLLLLLSGDVETCPGPVARCGLCLKTVRKNQSRMSSTQCNLMFHLKCFGSDHHEDLCGSCLLNNNVRGEPGQDQQDESYRYDIPELRELVSKRGLKILHQNIRGLLANKTTICQILDGFKNIHIFSVSETCLSPDN